MDFAEFLVRSAMSSIPPTVSVTASLLWAVVFAGGLAAWMEHLQGL